MGGHQSEQGMEMQFGQPLQGPARSVESLHAGDGARAAKPGLFGQTPSPTAPSTSRPYSQQHLAVGLYNSLASRRLHD